MTDTPWTPGPWLWADPEQKPWFHNYNKRLEIDDELEGAGGHYVLVGVWHNDSTAGVGVGVADARLIALAPEMADALADLLSRVDGVWADGEDSESGNAVRIARALLARARGETP